MFESDLGRISQSDFRGLVPKRCDVVIAWRARCRPASSVRHRRAGPRSLQCKNAVIAPQSSFRLLPYFWSEWHIEFGVCPKRLDHVFTCTYRIVYVHALTTRMVPSWHMSTVCH